MMLSAINKVANLSHKFVDFLKSDKPEDKKIKNIAASVLGTVIILGSAATMVTGASIIATVGVPIAITMIALGIIGGHFGGFILKHSLEALES